MSWIQSLFYLCLVLALLPDTASASGSLVSAAVDMRTQEKEIWPRSSKLIRSVQQLRQLGDIRRNPSLTDSQRADVLDGAGETAWS